MLLKGAFVAVMMHAVNIFLISGFAQFDPLVVGGIQ
jgi:hypothetical protein